MMDDDTTMSWVSSNEPAPNLATLPLELRVKIFGHLRPNTRFLPTTVVDKLKEEDEDGIADLLDLCVTSSRLLEAAQPLLYEAVHIVGRSYESYLHDEPDDKDEDELKEAVSTYDVEHRIIRQLTCLLRTLNMRPHLAKHIKHIRSTYGLGRAMQDCLWTKNAMRKAIDAGQPAMVERLSNSHTANLWAKMFNDTPAQAQIMLLLWLSPNVSELTLYTYDGPLSQILGLELSSNVPNFHNYAKLDTINIDGVDEDDDVAHPAYPEPESYDSCISTLEALPAMRHYRNNHPKNILGVLQMSVKRPPFRNDVLANLQSLHLVDCYITMEQMLGTLQPCRSLSDFRFRAANMAFDRMSEDEITHLDFVGICEALMPSKQTLRYLYLSMGIGPHTVRNVGTYNTLAAGTLKEFDRLETLIVPAAILTITSEKVDPDLENFHFQEDNLHILDHLPASVVLLGLSNDQTGQFFEENDHKWLAREAAAQLARGLVQLPNLQAVHILESQSSQIVYPRELQDRCVEDEIDFVIEKWMEDDRLMVKHYGITT